MAFSWHKLIPSTNIIPTSVVCPPPCTATDSGTIVNNAKCVFNTNGTIVCSFNQWTYNVEGAQCGGKSVLSGGVRTNPGKPIELRINAPLGCTIANDPALQDSVGQQEGHGGTAEMGSYPPQQFYYYRTPNSPSSTPSTLTTGEICFKFNPYSIPDRVVVISGRNRYRYSGWCVDPNANGTIPDFWHNPDVGATGLSQAEGAIGRSFPLPNSVLNLPLFGADTAQNPGGGAPIPCSDGACVGDTTCFSVRGNSGIGHFDTTSAANGKGYYSFQCFNAQSFYQTTSVPTCSVWSWLQAIWYKLWTGYVDFYGGDEAGFRTAYPQLTTAFNTIFTTDPGGTVPSGLKQYQVNLRKVLEDFVGYANLASSNDWEAANIVFPNVFLWDKDAYNAASTADKYKHLYIVGNANVIFDTQCLLGEGTEGSNARYGYTIHLDEVSHDATYGSTGNARLIGFFGCNPSSGSNSSSQAYFEMNTMDCVPESSYCEDCPNENTDTTTSRCEYYGYQSNCLYTPSNGFV